MIETLEFELPERVLVAQHNALLPFLRDNPDVAVNVSAARLRRIDTPLVQALLAVAADRRARSVPFALTGLSPDNAAQIALLGVTDAMISFQVVK